MHNMYTFIYVIKRYTRGNQTSITLNVTLDQGGIGIAGSGILNLSVQDGVDDTAS